MIRAALILLILASAAVPTPALAGSSFAGLSKAVQIIELAKIEEQFAEAWRTSQAGLSKEELAKIKAKADKVLSDAKEQGQDGLDETGAMVFCSSQIVK